MHSAVWEIKHELHTVFIQKVQESMKLSEQISDVLIYNFWAE